VVALAAAQVQTGYDLISMELGFPMVDDPDMHEDLIKEFYEVAAEIVDITPAQGVVNKVFELLVIRNKSLNEQSYPLLVMNSSLKILSHELLCFVFVFAL
jgi:hypothetical protein